LIERSRTRVLVVGIVEGEIREMLTSVLQA